MTLPRLLLLSLPLSALVLIASPAQAESRTAESIWSQSDAEQRAIDQIPVADRSGISNTRCQEVGVGRMGSLPRFRCTVWFTPALPAPAAPAAPASPAVP
ncbi:MAG: hypothetical protein VKL58_04075 [Cyanobacteriota bacterium]|nr:hypothetical protein [Cyanobacteriota bacterium]